jgi:hypothetical protein
MTEQERADVLKAVTSTAEFTTLQNGPAGLTY